MDFAARSVICPDMYIGTNEIGIPMVRRNKGVPPYDTVQECFQLHSKQFKMERFTDFCLDFILPYQCVNEGILKSKKFLQYKLNLEKRMEKEELPLLPWLMN